MHVRDSSNPDISQQSATVIKTLNSLPLASNTPIITVDSKIDVIEMNDDLLKKNGASDVIPVSSMTGQGIEQLFSFI